MVAGHKFIPMEEISVEGLGQGNGVDMAKSFCERSRQDVYKVGAMLEKRSKSGKGLLYFMQLPVAGPSPSPGLDPQPWLALVVAPGPWPLVGPRPQAPGPTLRRLARGLGPRAGQILEPPPSEGKAPKSKHSRSTRDRDQVKVWCERCRKDFKVAGMEDIRSHERSGKHYCMRPEVVEQREVAKRAAVCKVIEQRKRAKLGVEPLEEAA